MNNIFDTNNSILLKYVDSRNQDIWDYLTERWTFLVSSNTEDNWGVYCNNNIATFYIPEKGGSCEDFMHELLHVYIRDKGCLVGSSLDNTIRQSVLMSKIFSPNLLDQIDNVLAHEKMFPIFTERGYEKKKFVVDFEIPKFNNEKLAKAKIAKKNPRKYIIDFADGFIGSLFSMFFDCNIDLNYEHYYRDFKNLDRSLFAIVEKSVYEWDDIELSGGQDIYLQCVSWAASFYESLKPWITTNRIYLSDH